MSPYEKLKELGIELEAPESPVAKFVPVVRTGNSLYVSGHIARKGGKSMRGKLGDDMTTEQGKVAARAAALDLLATLHVQVGLDAVARIVKLMVLVNSTQEFTEQHLVANGASELLLEVFGEKGAHARSAFGVAQIPFGSAIEIDMVVELA